MNKKNHNHFNATKQNMAWWYLNYLGPPRSSRLKLLFFSDWMFVLVYQHCCLEMLKEQIGS